MANTTISIKQPFLFLPQKSHLKWNPLLSSQYSFQPFNPHKKPHRPTPITLKCFLTPSLNNNNSLQSDKHGNFICKDGISVSAMENVENPLEKLAKVMYRAFKVLQKPAVAAVLVGLLLIHDPNSALAASGGRMGGKSFSSSRSSSSSKSYSVPRTSGDSSFSYSVPYYAPSPFGVGGGGIYVGPVVGIGSSFFMVLVGFAAFILVSGFLSDRPEGGVLTATEKTSVLKLQVALLGLGRSLQKDLDRIAESADTSTSEGLSYVLTETSLALLRHPDYCISAYSSADVKRSLEEGEKRFNQLSIEERGKFDEETLVNVNNIKKRSSTGQRASGFSNEYIVVTILVAAEGVHKLPTINGNSDLKEALKMLASIPSSKTLAVEVLWTPQSETDALSERELLEDYPLLRPL